jgi:hypothetical protein
MIRMDRFSLKFCTAMEWPGAHQDVAAVLQQGVHRHHEEAGQAPISTIMRQRQPAGR